MLIVINPKTSQFLLCLITSTSYLPAKPRLVHPFDRAKPHLLRGEEGAASMDEIRTLSLSKCTVTLEHAPAFTPGSQEVHWIGCSKLIHKIQ